MDALFSLGNRGSADWFSGTVWVQPLVAANEIEGLYSVGQVTFEPGGRTFWHVHPVGQVLLVTAGSGFYQERGKEPRHLAKGDVVVIPKDEEHWHGASRDSRLVHVAISNFREDNCVTWLAAVSEEEYAAVHQ